MAWAASRAQWCSGALAQKRGPSSPETGGGVGDGEQQADGQPLRTPVGWASRAQANHQGHPGERPTPGRMGWVPQGATRARKGPHPAAAVRGWGSLPVYRFAPSKESSASLKRAEGRMTASASAGSGR